MIHLPSNSVLHPLKHTFITHGDYDSAYKTIFYLDTGFHGGDILYIPSVKVRVGSVSRTDVLTTLSLY